MSTPMPSATIDNNPFTTAPPTTTLQSTSTASAPVVTDASGVNQASLFTHSMTANNRNTDGETDDDGGVDSIAVIIGAVAAALICVMCVVLALALAYRKRVKDQQINAAIASQTNTSAHFETFPVAMPMGAGPHVNNTVYQPSAFSTQAFDSAAAVAGAFQCPMCTNCYPTDNDVLIHVQRRHPNSSYVSATTGDFSTASFRPQVTYDSELPRDDAKYRAYDIPTQPSHLYVIAPPTQSERGSDSGTMSMSHEPSNYRGLQPYSTMGEERFAKFQQ
jgi:hypothetical protein